MPDITLWKFHDEELDVTLRVVGEAPKGLNPRNRQIPAVPPTRVEVMVYWRDEPEWVTLKEYMNGERDR